MNINLPHGQLSLLACFDSLRLKGQGSKEFRTLLQDQAGRSTNNWLVQCPPQKAEPSPLSHFSSGKQKLPMHAPGSFCASHASSRF